MDKDLKEFRKNNEENLQKGQDDFEKQLSFISAGALGLSMFLIEKVVHNLSQSKNKWLIITSWSLLGITLVTNLISHYFAVKFNYKNIQEIDLNKYDLNKAIKRNNTINRINFFSLMTLIIGIIFLILFSSLNI